MNRTRKVIFLLAFDVLPSASIGQSIEELLDTDLSTLVEVEIVTPGRRGQTARGSSIAETHLSASSRFSLDPDVGVLSAGGEPADGDVARGHADDPTQAS